MISCCSKDLAVKIEPQIESVQSDNTDVSKTNVNNYNEPFKLMKLDKC